MIEFVMILPSFLLLIAWFTTSAFANIQKEILNDYAFQMVHICAGWTRPEKLPELATEHLNRCMKAVINEKLQVSTRIPGLCRKHSFRHSAKFDPKQDVQKLDDAFKVNRHSALGVKLQINTLRLKFDCDFDYIFMSPTWSKLLFGKSYFKIAGYAAASYIGYQTSSDIPQLYY
jgi:hypothetical protein